jgi:uncharacterized membrane protein
MVEPAGRATSNRQRHLDRVESFSDAVFAIAATLLVIDLRPPAGDVVDYERALQTYLSRPGPFIAMAIGFLVVGSYWVSHRKIFALLRDVDGLVVWANLVFLFWVAIQPFFTAALADHDATRTSVIAYAVCQVLAGAAQLGVWAAVLHDRRLLIDEVGSRRLAYVTIQLLRAPIAFAISIPVTVIGGPTAGSVAWTLLIVFAIVINVVFRDLSPRRARTTRSTEPATSG